MNYLNSFLSSFAVLGILGLCACGSCQGMALCGASSALHSHSKTVRTYSYVAMIMISTVFFYGFIIAIIIINKLGGIEEVIDYERNKTTLDLPLKDLLMNGLGLKGLEVKDLVAGILFGTIGLFSGRSMGEISKNSLKCIAKNNEFYSSFMISLASVEVTLVIGFLCSLLIVYS